MILLRILQVLILQITRKVVYHWELNWPKPVQLGVLSDPRSIESLAQPQPGWDERRLGNNSIQMKAYQYIYIYTQYVEIWKHVALKKMVKVRRIHYRKKNMMHLEKLYTIPEHWNIQMQNYEDLQVVQQSSSPIFRGRNLDTWAAATSSPNEVVAGSETCAVPLDPIGGLSPYMALIKHIETLLTWRLKAHNWSAKSSKLHYNWPKTQRSSPLANKKQGKTSRSQFPTFSSSTGRGAARATMKNGVCARGKLRGKIVTI